MKFTKTLLLGLCLFSLFACGNEIELPVPPELIETQTTVTARMSAKVAERAFDFYEYRVRTVLKFRDAIDRLNPVDEKFEVRDELDREFSFREWDLSGTAHLEFQSPCGEGFVSLNLLLIENMLDRRVWGTFENCPRIDDNGSWVIATRLTGPRTIDLSQVYASMSFPSDDAETNISFEIVDEIVSAPVTGEFGTGKLVSVLVTYKSSEEFDVAAIDGSWSCESVSRTCQNGVEEISW